MTDGWGDIAAAMGRGRSDGGDDETRPGPDRSDREADTAVPAGWEGVRAARQAGDVSDRKPEAVPARRAPAGWEGVSRRRPTGVGVAEAVVVEDTEASTDDEPADRAVAPHGPPSLGGRLDDLRRRHPRAVIGAAGGTILLIAAIVIAVVLSTGGGLPTGAAFSVDGDVTTVAQLNSQITVLDQLDNVTPPAKTNKAAYGTFLRTSAHALAVQQLVTQLAARRHITVSDKSTRDQLDQIVSSQYGGDRSKLDGALSSAGLSEAQILTVLHTQQIENSLYTSVTKAVNVTDAQVSDAFTANQRSLAQPEQRAVSIILVATQATGQDVLNQLSSGADFATLAGQDSLDASKTSGGAVGTFTQADLQSSGLAPAVFSAPQGAPFGPVQVSGGEWVVGEVTAITPATQYANDAQTQAGIKNYLTDEQLRSQWIAFLTKQLKIAHITYAATYRPANPQQAPQPALPTLAQFVANAHTSATSGSSPSGSSTGTPTTPGAAPTSP